MQNDDRAAAGPSKQETLTYVLDMLKQLAALLHDCDETATAGSLLTICDAKQKTSGTGAAKAARRWTRDQN